MTSSRREIKNKIIEWFKQNPEEIVTGKDIQKLFCINWKSQVQDILYSLENKKIITSVYMGDEKASVRFYQNFKSIVK